MTSSPPIEACIWIVRGARVMLDADLARLYGVEVRTLNHGERRLRGHNVKYRPLAFTEQGVAMLSSVLRSRQAVRANVEIMRAFVRLRAMAAQSTELARRLDALESKYDRQFKVVFDAIRELMAPSQPARKHRIGFVSEAALTKYRSVQPN